MNIVIRKKGSEDLVYRGQYDILDFPWVGNKLCELANEAIMGVTEQFLKAKLTGFRFVPDTDVSLDTVYILDFAKGNLVGTIESEKILIEIPFRQIVNGYTFNNYEYLYEKIYWI